MLPIRTPATAATMMTGISWGSLGLAVAGVVSGSMSEVVGGAQVVFVV